MCLMLTKPMVCVENICINKINILYYDRIDVFEDIDAIKTSSSIEFVISNYFYFLDKEFKFQPDLRNGCHDVLVMSMNLNNIAILNICGVDYRCIINGITKSEVVNLLQNAYLSKKIGSL